MVKKVLYIANTHSHIRAFHLPYIRDLKSLGYTVHVAARSSIDSIAGIEDIDCFYDIPFLRSPFKLGNIKAYKKLKKLINTEKYDIITTHTPIGGLLGRLASRKQRKVNNTKVYYTAHGFHFYQGCSKLSWLSYYNIEKFFANKYTDILFTINEEDFNLAKNKFKVKSVLQQGMGLDKNIFNSITKSEKNALRDKYNFKSSDIIVLSIGELNQNKNHVYLIELIRDLIIENPKIKLLIAGEGPLYSELNNRVIDINLTENIILLGYRKDIKHLIAISDIIASSSKREGLPMNILEAMGSGKPIFASNIRGHRDLIRTGENGFLFDFSDFINAKNIFNQLIIDEELRQRFGEKSLQESESYSIDIVKKFVLEYFK